MYLPNKYTRWYESIVAAAKTRPIVGYVERHHIIPKSLGGSDAADNIVALTAREHYICHWLLTKMTTGKSKSKMWLAVLKMCVVSGTHQRRKIPAYRYEQIRKQARKANSGVNSPTYGRKRPADEQARITAALNASRALAPPRTHSEETKKKIGAANRGHSPSPEVRARWSKIRKGRPGQDNNSGKHWYNDGVRSYLKKDCPEGCVPGRLV